MIPYVRFILCIVLTGVTAQNLRIAQNDNGDVGQKANGIKAVLHLGPMKTGTSAIGEGARKTKRTLVEDGYTISPFNSRDIDPATVVGCFVKEDKKVFYSVNFTCNESALQETQEIASVHGQSLLMSSEFLSNPDMDVEKLKDFLKAWDHAQVVAYYRRFYDWIVSFHNQYQKFSAPGQRMPIDRYVTDLYTGEQHPEHYYIMHTVRNYKPFIPDIRYVHMSHMPNKNGIEAFFCEALADAPKTCEKIKELLKENDKEHNHSLDLVYEDLAYYSKEQGLWKDGGNLDLKLVSYMAKQRQEKHNKLSKYDFEYKNCPSKQTLDWFLEQSLEVEKELFPEFYVQAGEKEVREEFAKYSVTKLCSIDAKAVIDNDESWRKFFKSL